MLDSEVERLLIGNEFGIRTDQRRKKRFVELEGDWTEGVEIQGSPIPVIGVGKLVER